MRLLYLGSYIMVFHNHRYLLIYLWPGQVITWYMMKTPNSSYTLGNIEKTAYDLLVRDLPHELYAAFDTLTPHS